MQRIQALAGRQKIVVTLEMLFRCCRNISKVYMSCSFGAKDNGCNCIHNLNAMKLEHNPAWNLVLAEI